MPEPPFRIFNDLLIYEVSFPPSPFGEERGCVRVLAKWELSICVFGVRRNTFWKFSEVGMGHFRGLDWQCKLQLILASDIAFCNRVSGSAVRDQEFPNDFAAWHLKELEECWHIKCQMNGENREIFGVAG